jgi:hypothetical protein
MIYIQQIALLNHKQPEGVDVKALCKKVAAKFVRRTDRFIQLGILGVEQIQRKQPLSENTALYLTSGQGNIGVFQRLCDCRLIEQSPPKPVDFINSLSNTAGFYIAQFLGLNSTSNNLYHHGFVVEMALMLADCNLTLQKEQQILLGGVDQLFQPAALAREYLGLTADVPLGEGSNWMLLNNSRENALASLEVVREVMTLAQLKTAIDAISEEFQVAFALRCPDELVDELQEHSAGKRFAYEKQISFYETVTLYALNAFIATEKGLLLFVDYFSGQLRLIKLNVF